MTTPPPTSPKKHPVRRALRSVLGFPLDLVFLAFDWVRLVTNRVLRVVKSKKRTCPFCRDSGYAYQGQFERCCYASKKYANPWLARSLCSGLRRSQHVNAPYECRFPHTSKGPAGRFFVIGLVCLLLTLSTAVTLQVTADFFPRAANKVRRMVFGPPLPPGLANDPALRELQLRLLKLSGEDADPNPELAATYAAQGDRHRREESFRLARLEYAIAARLDPGNGALWHKLGVCNLRLGEISSAQQAFEHELQVAGESEIAHGALAFTYALTSHPGQALEHALAVHEQSPGGNTLALQELLELYTRRRNAKAASEVCATLLNTAPDHAPAQSAVGRTYSGFANYKKAEPFFRRALELQPDHLPSLLGLASVLIQLKQIDEAHTALATALILAPDLPAAQALSIEIAHRREGDAAAIALLKERLLQDPDDTWTRIRLAELLTFAGDFDLANELASTLVESEDFRIRWPGLWLQARMFYAQGLYQKAIEVCHPLVEQNHYALEARMLQAQAMVNREEYHAAVSQLNQTVRIFPAHRPAYLLLCEALVRLGNTAQAEVVLDRIVQQQEGSAASFQLKGDYYLLTGDQPELAREAYEQAMDLAPDNVMLRYDYILLLAEQLQDLDTAEQLARSQHEASPENPLFMDLSGWISFRRNQLDRALPLLEQAVATAPNVPVFRHHFASALHEQGNDERAQRELRIALAIKPNFYGARQARELLKQLEDAEGRE